MSRFTATFLRLALPSALLVIGLAGCTGANVGTPAQSTLPGLPTAGVTTTTTLTASAKPADADYRRLLLTAADLSDADDTFSPRSNATQPSGLPGASAFFVNAKDTRAVSDTVLVYPDAAAAAAALKDAADTLATTVTGGQPTSAPVGSGGVTITGTTPTDDKAVTVLLFTEGRAFVRLDFQSAPGDTTTERYVNAIGKMQQIALRVGLAAPQ